MTNEKLTDGLDKCGVCGHSASVTYGRDIRFADDNRLMWRAECGSDDPCSAPTFTRFTREKAVESWNTHMRVSIAQQEPKT